MKTAILILIVGMLFVFAGCVTLYKPNAIHSPLLKEKGELNATASLGLAGCGLYNLQTAYAISNHAGVMLNGMYHVRNNSSNEKINMLFGEAGAGYFTRFAANRNGLFQCYGGGGYGNTTDIIYNTDQPNPEASARYYNLFIQPGVAYISKGLEVSFDLRANYVRLFDIYAYLYDQFEFWNTDFEYYPGVSLDFMNLEPTTTLKFGKGNLKGVLQLGATFPVVNSNSYFKVNPSAILLLKFSAGISYTFNCK